MTQAIAVPMISKKYCALKVCSFMVGLIHYGRFGWKEEPALGYYWPV